MNRLKNQMVDLETQSALLRSTHKDEIEKLKSDFNNEQKTSYNESFEKKSIEQIIDELEIKFAREIASYENIKTHLEEQIEKKTRVYFLRF